MFFEPFHVRFPIRGSYSRKTRRLALEDSAVSVAYLPEYPDRCQQARLKIVRIVDASSLQEIESRYFRLEGSDRMRGDLAVARLRFEGRAFSSELAELRKCPEGRALYQAILHQGRIELTIEDASHETRPITNLFLELRYGTRPERC